MGNDYNNTLRSTQADLELMEKVLKKIGFKVLTFVNLGCRESMEVIKQIAELVVPGVYIVFFYSGHGCNVGNTDYIIPSDAHDPINIHECIAIATISDYFQSKLCRVFMIMNCYRSTPHDLTSIPKHQRKCNYSNYAIINASVEGHRAFDEAGRVTSFTAALADSIREGGTYREVLDRVLEKIKTVRVSDGVGTYSQPIVNYSTMDPQISFNDPIMMDDPNQEQQLDELQQMYTATNSTF